MGNGTSKPNKREGDDLSFTSVIEALEYWSAKYPTREYCRVMDESGKEQPITFKDLHEESKKYATWLKSQGLSKGERVVLALPNERSFLTSFLGTLMAGGVAVPVAVGHRLLSGLDRTAELIGHVLRDSAAKYTVTTESHAAVCEEALKRSQQGGVISIVEKMPKNIQFSQDPLTVFSEDIAFIQYTSGSTSLPKGVVILHKQLIAQIQSIITGLKSNAKDVVVSWLPLFHDMGLIGAFLHSLYVGMKLILMSPERFLFDPKQWLLAISKYRATMSSGPNSAFGMCSARVRPEDLTGLDLSSWRVAFSGAEPISIQTIDQFKSQFSQCGFNPQAFVAGYGMAENCLAITFQKPGVGLKYDCISRAEFETNKKAVHAKPEDSNIIYFVSCGKPVLNNEVMIVDEVGKILGEREVGEVIVRGPSVMQGYFKKELETRKTIRNQWLFTGDLGYLANEELYITGRKKDMIIKGGKNYCPHDIELSVQKVEGVRGGATIAIGIYDEKTATEKMIILAEIKPKFFRDQTKIIANIKKEVTRDIGVTPDEVHIYPRGVFQRTTSGKIQRAKHKQLFLSGKLKTKITLIDRFHYFKFRISLLLSMFFYYLSSKMKHLMLWLLFNNRKDTKKNDKTRNHKAPSRNDIDRSARTKSG